MHSNCTYHKMIASKQFVPHDGRIFFHVDGSYSIANERGLKAQEPVDLVSIHDGRMLYTFAEDGEIRLCMDISRLDKVEF